MSEVICEVCGRKIDSRGLSGHMRTHKGKPKESDTDGIISYPSNEHGIENETQAERPVLQNRTKKKETVKKPVKKPVASPVASSPASSPRGNDPRGQLKTETEHKEEWKGFFR